MKRLTGFINGFIACFLMVYSLIIFVIYKWAKAEDICGFEIKQRYSTNRPKYKYPVKYSYVPSAPYPYKPYGLVCDGCVHKGAWEDEVELGYDSPCTVCKRRASDRYEMEHPYTPPTYESRSKLLSRDIDIRVLKIRFTSEEMANEAKNWLIEQLESYKYVSAFDYFSHVNAETYLSDHEYGWGSEIIKIIESTEPKRLDDNCWYLALEPVSYIEKE